MIAIILAAGKSKRMKSKTPKVLLPILGQPLVNYPINTAKKAGASRIIVVISKGSQISKYIKDVDFVTQKVALGTGDAVKAGLRKVKKSEYILILNGDNPLISASTIKKMDRKFKKRKADGILLTAIVDEPTGYGRIVRDNRNSLLKIVEEKSLSSKERAIKEVNVGAYIFKTKPLQKALKKLKLDKKKKEYLLTDIVSIMSQQGNKLIGYQGDINESFGVNTKKEYLMVHNILRKRILKDLIKRGVVIENPATVEIESGTKIDAGVSIGSYSHIKKGVQIGTGTNIGPFTWIGEVDGED